MEAQWLSCGGHSPPAKSLRHSIGDPQAAEGVRGAGLSCLLSGQLQATPLATRSVPPSVDSRPGVRVLPSRDPGDALLDIGEDLLVNDALHPQPLIAVKVEDMDLIERSSNALRTPRWTRLMKP